MIAPVRGLSSKSMAIVLAVLLAAYVLGVFALKHMTDLAPGGRLLLHLGLEIGFMAAVLGICIGWWRGKDEAQQEAQKWAWYWGASFGMPVLLTVAFILTFDHDRLLAALLQGIGARDALGMAFIIGILITLVPMCLGALIAWTVWWSRRR